MKCMTGDGVSIDLRGHWLYVRKCRLPEYHDGIVLQARSRENNSWAEVLGVGADCGKARKGKGTVPGSVPEVGDLVLFPNITLDSRKLQKSPFGLFEYFVHENEALAVWSK